MADAMLAKGYQVRVLDSLDATFNGGEENVAISLARLGIHASFVSAVRDSDFGDAARAFLGTVAAQLQRSARPGVSGLAAAIELVKRF